MSKFLCTLFGSRGRSAGLLLLRLFAGGILLPHGIQKLQNFEAFADSFGDPIGLGPKFSLILIMAAEILGSVCIILGLLTRPAALAVAFGMFVAAFFSNPAGFDMQAAQLPLLLMGIYLSLMITGAGRYSVDEALRRKTCLP